MNVDYKYSYIGTPKNNEYPLISHISFRCAPNDIFPTGYKSVFIQSVFFENYDDINIALTDILKEVVLEIEPNYFNNNIVQLSLF